MMASTMLLFAIDFYAARTMTRKFRDNRQDTLETDTAVDSPASSPVVDEKGQNFGHTHDFSGVATEIMAKDPLSQRAHWEVQLLEAGIIFHSVMIGVALGSQGGSTFVCYTSPLSPKLLY
jgi:zinc transporter 1/2/3